jgi:hypothetical protein
MKIKSLLEIIEPKISQQQYKGSFKTSRNADDDILQKGETPDNTFSQKNVLGRGYYSAVSKDRKDPHMVKKHNTRFDDIDDDPYRLYAKFIIDNKLFENPYFPRIYQHKKIKDKKGNILHKFQLEKLEELNKLSHDEIDHILRVIFKEPEKIINSFKTAHVPSRFEDRKKQRKLIAIAKEIKEAINHNHIYEIKDKNLIHAIREINHFMNHECKNCYNDLHPKNLMARRTPYGAQLVITDPVSDL